MRPFERYSTLTQGLEVVEIWRAGSLIGKTCRWTLEVQDVDVTVTASIIGLDWLY